MSKETTTSSTEDTKSVQQVAGNLTMKDRLETFLWKDAAFILMVAMASAAILAGTSLFMTKGTGLLNDIPMGIMLKAGAQSGDYTSAASFSAAFLMARILEGPLVGILDIGGSLMTGVGVGISALFLSFGWRALVYNFGLALLAGFILGGVIGAVIMAVRKVSLKDAPVGAAAIMMGAGNKSGEALGPLVLIAAISYSLPIGVGATIGAALLYHFHKPMVAGAILGVLAIAALMLIVGINPIVLAK